MASNTQSTSPDIEQERQTSIPLIRHEFVDVDTHSKCPDPDCEIVKPHTCWGLTINSLQPSSCIPQLPIRRFLENENPFPNTNRWVIDQEPPFVLQDGLDVFLVEYGVVTLWSSEDEVCGEKIKWKVFRCVNSYGKLETEVVVRKNWYKKKAKGLRKYRSTHF